MNFRNKICFVVCFLFLLNVLIGEEEYRTFTSSDGRNMEAKVVRVNGSEVTIERKGETRKMTVNMTVFSKSDQEYFKRWDELNRLSQGNALEVVITRSTSGTDKRSSGATNITQWKEGYKISINNESRGDFENLKVYYQLFKFEEAVAATERNDGVMNRKAGSFDIRKLESRGSEVHETIQFDMMTTELKAGWTYTNGGDVKSKDKLDGCWVRVYRGDDLVLEYSLPESVMRKQPWDEPKRK